MNIKWHDRGSYFDNEFPALRQGCNEVSQMNDLNGLPDEVSPGREHETVITFSRRAAVLGGALAALTLPQVATAKPNDYFPPPDSEGGWRTLKDAASIRKLADMDLARLDQAYEYTQRCSQNGGLLVVRHGYLVYEKYWGRAGRTANPDMASTGKAYTSIACGIMLKEFHDKIPDGLDTKVFTEKYLPEAFPLDDPRKADITLGQLLCMSAGYHGEGGSPGVVMGKVVPLQQVPGQDIRNLDQSSLRTPLWTGSGWQATPIRPPRRISPRSFCAM